MISNTIASMSNEFVSEDSELEMEVSESFKESLRAVQERTARGQELFKDVVKSYQEQMRTVIEEALPQNRPLQIFGCSEPSICIQPMRIDELMDNIKGINYHMEKIDTNTSYIPGIKELVEDGNGQREEILSALIDFITISKLLPDKEKKKLFDKAYQWIKGLDLDPTRIQAWLLIADHLYNMVP